MLGFLFGLIVGANLAFVFLSMFFINKAKK